MIGGVTPIVSVLVGDEEDTLNAGTIPLREGLLRAVGDVPGRALSRRRPAHPGQRQPPDASIAGLLDAMKALTERHPACRRPRRPPRDMAA